jgi:addiction module RelE/StbE family toxin
MNIDYSSHFKKSYKKLPKKIQDRFDERISLFEKDENDYILKNHKLHGEYDGYRSINITSDIRAIYRIVSGQYYFFVAIGTHSELYE